MRLLNTLCAAALFVPALASANELDRLYGMALGNDPVLRAAAAQRDAALEAKPQARGALLPQINATGSYGQEDNTSQRRAGGMLSPPDHSKAATRSYGASLSQTLFSRAQWLALQQADDQVALAHANYRYAEQSLLLRATQAYFNLLAADDGVRFADAEKQAVERQLDLAKKRFEVGLSAVTDVQETQARYDLVTAQMISAEQNLASARIAVGDIAGAADVHTVPLRDDIPLVGPVPANLGEWLKAADEGNLSLKAAEIVAAIADKGIDIAGSGHWPVLSADASYTNSTSGGFLAKSDDTRYGVTLNVPLFSGGITQSRVRAAKATHEQRVAELAGARRKAGSDAQIAYQNVLAGAAIVKARKQALLSNTTALEASSVGLEVGSRTTVDVLNAQQQLFAAQRDYARSRYDYLLAVLQLKATAGQLMQKDLVEVDALLGLEATPDPARK